jgi:thiol-disulfide isomerase/thioredoxin
MRRTTFIVLSVVLVTAVFGIALTRRLISTWHPEATAEQGLGALTPADGLILKFSDRPVDLPPVALTGLDGQPITLSAAAGKVLLVNFWATWCGPCREEIPALVALKKHYGDRLVIVGLSIDERPAADVKQFADGMGVNYPIAIVKEDVQAAFGGVPAVPSTFVVNPAGKIVTRHMGLVSPALIEHEVRTLSGLPTTARVETVKDTGQVLLANAAYATEIPGVDLAKLTPSQKERALTRMNTEHCTCGCGLTLAQCRINDPSCEVSLPVAKKIAADVAMGR